jgi:heme exporter protein B
VNGPRVALAVLRKDLLLDLRSRDRLGHMIFFAALVVVLLSITLPAPDDRTRAWIPSLLWVVFLFTSLLGLGRSTEAQALIATLAAVFLDVEWGAAIGPAIPLAVLGAVGLSCVGTLFSMMAASARFRELLLPLMLFPLALPLLVYASRATSELLFLSGSVPTTSWGFLLLYDWIFALLGYFVFDYVLEE